MIYCYIWINFCRHITLNRTHCILLQTLMVINIYPIIETCLIRSIHSTVHRDVKGSTPPKPISSPSTPSSVTTAVHIRYAQPRTSTANTMGDLSQSSAEEVVSIDESAAIGQGDPHSSYSTIPLSKKAIHQRDADENLFLRFLELDPVPDPATASSTALAASVAASAAIANSASDQRRKSTYRPTTGRTPFTISKRLVRSSDKGFGFSIVWTHPPRIEKVEKGLSADQAGITTGDFLIFVDKDNVVTMPEIDILNLIRSQGNTLNVEIFRRSTQTRPSNGTGSGASNANFMRRSSITFSNNQMMVEQATSKQVAQQHQEERMQHQQELRPSTACSYEVSGSVENTKRSLKLPSQVTFNKDVRILLIYWLITKHIYQVYICIQIKQSASPLHSEDQSRRYLYQLINREQHFVSALQFGMQRFVLSLQERADLISAGDHRTLFQNIEEILRLSEDIMEQLVPEDHEPQVHFASRVYLSKSTALCAAYKRYCNGLKRADCVLVSNFQL